MQKCKQYHINNMNNVNISTLSGFIFALYRYIHTNVVLGIEIFATTYCVTALTLSRAS